MIDLTSDHGGKLGQRAPVRLSHDAPTRRARAAGPDWPALMIVAFTALFALAVWSAMPTEALMRVMAEDGPVETTTAALFFVLALGMYWLRPQGDDRCTWLAMAILCAACGAREMDWHKAWTGKSVLKLSFYLESAPMGQKLLALAVLALVALCVVYLALRHGRRLWRNLLLREPVAVTVATLLVATAITKILDRSINLLANDYGVVTAPPIWALVSALEESIELSLPLMVVLGLWQSLQARSRAAGGPAGRLNAVSRSTVSGTWPM
ncbi:MAG: hypothetical protein V4792_15915 [Pseudomonadota bacterium]